MSVSRRTFLKYCGAIAASVGIDPFEIGLLKQAMADPNGPVVIWMHGSSCTGCSVSLLNRISDRVGEPATITDVLADAINLVYHPTIMSSAGEGAGAILKQAYDRGNYVLVLEGGVPTAFNGHCCIAYSFDGKEVTYQEAVTDLATRASAVVCAGTCASFGGIPRSMSNPTRVVSISELTGASTINISGCPANPDWVIWAIVQLILGNTVTLDGDNRPVDLYAKDLYGDPAEALIHDKCPRNGEDEATGFGDTVGKCLIKLGCRGPDTKARCENCWNGTAGQNGKWCIGVNAPCHGCTERTFPGPEPFYTQYSTI